MSESKVCPTCHGDVNIVGVDVLKDTKEPRWGHVRIEPSAGGYTDHKGLFARNRLELVYRSEAEAKIERLTKALEYYADDESGTDNCGVAREALDGK